MFLYSTRMDYVYSKPKKPNEFATQLEEPENIEKWRTFFEEYNDI